MDDGSVGVFLRAWRFVRQVREIQYWSALHVAVEYFDWAQASAVHAYELAVQRRRFSFLDTELGQKMQATMLKTKARQQQIEAKQWAVCPGRRSRRDTLGKGGVHETGARVIFRRFRWS